MADEVAGAKPRRRRRSREETESDLLDAALRIMRRDGLLEGVALRDVAAEAGVNHGQIYQYFGSRQALLRAAITRLLQRSALDRDTHWEQPFAQRRTAMWRWALQQPDLPKLEALLALEGDDQLVLFPELERTRQALDRDRATGALPRDSDADVVHAMTAATYMGYCIFREAIARELGLELGELDARAGAVYERLVAGLAEPAPEDRSAPRDMGS
ncbi:TetR/AcrR family transcriptional regulator [Saccharopolyspora indica]|uniref:TetR/AcrR family transcriptional regulator n=1 Tax=Saccharopolyspora indica TaxID=1229659 RepID=UPI0022EB7975|nr:TetR/AcrR family transcriptional regulator [Saccharopolyspora indica]MDA3646889.1 helix-turn-helix domain containing protein [Saccharopolyspora indica]